VSAKAVDEFQRNVPYRPPVDNPPNLSSKN